MTELLTNPDAVTDADLDAYVDNQLDLAGRARVEEHLARNGAAAARVMADLGIRSRLKLALGAPDGSSDPRMSEAARKLSAGLAGQRSLGVFRRAAAIVLLLSAGWLGSNVLHPFGPRAVNASSHPPEFVAQAIAAHRTADLRQAMPSQASAGRFDAEEIRSATAIVMPALPKGWSISDVEIFPSDFGPSVEASVVTADRKRISLFAVRPGHFAVDPVESTAIDGSEAAWWQIGDVAYALVSDTGDAGLRQKAETLKSSLY